MLWTNAKGELFADSKAVGESGYRVAGAELKHLGFGEFELVTPVGTVEFDRLRGEPFPGCSGRPHKVYGPAEAVALLVAALSAEKAA